MIRRVLLGMGAAALLRWLPSPRITFRSHHLVATMTHVIADDSVCLSAHCLGAKGTAVTEQISPF
jgi:hypothetical protein